MIGLTFTFSSFFGGLERGFRIPLRNLISAVIFSQMTSIVLRNRSSFDGSTLQHLINLPPCENKVFSLKFPSLTP